MAPTPRAIRRGAAVISVIVFAALVVHNVYWLVENQRTLPAHDRPHRSPRSLEEVARQSPRKWIRTQLAAYYHLARHIPGARLTLTPSLASDRWFFERVGRVHVTTSPVRLAVVRGSARRLRANTTVAGGWRITDKRGKPTSARLNLRIDPLVRDYVLAERRDRRELFLLPAADYQAVASVAAPVDSGVGQR